MRRWLVEARLQPAAATREAAVRNRSRHHRRRDQWKANRRRPPRSRRRYARVAQARPRIQGHARRRQQLRRRRQPRLRDRVSLHGEAGGCEARMLRIQRPHRHSRGWDARRDHRELRARHESRSVERDSSRFQDRRDPLRMTRQSRDSAYSLKTATGSLRLARVAGIHAATPLVTANNNAPATNVTGSVGATLNNRFVITFVPNSATTPPAPNPATVSASPRRTTSHRT